MTCEFCEELNSPGASRFASIYCGLASTRIVARHGPFVAMPTLGQLYRGSLLVLPTDHTETIASVSDDDLRWLEEFISGLKRIIGLNGNVIAFEHGARCHTNGGCGIYHAHLHLVPVPACTLADDLLPNTSSQSASGGSGLRAALRELRSSAEYLLVQDTEQTVKYLDLKMTPKHSYQSQYFRVRLVELHHLDRPWDWRAYTAPEAAMMDTIGLFER